MENMMRQLQLIQDEMGELRQEVFNGKGVAAGLERQLMKSQTKIKNLEHEASESKVKIGELSYSKSRIDELEDEVTNLKEKILNIEDDLNNSKSKSAKLEGKLTDNQRKTESLEEFITKQKPESLSSYEAKILKKKMKNIEKKYNEAIEGYEKLTKLQSILNGSILKFQSQLADSQSLSSANNLNDVPSGSLDTATRVLRNDNVEGASDVEHEFPLYKLRRLEEYMSRPQWVVPVSHSGELEVLLNTAIKLSKEGKDTRSAACQRFYREALTEAFTKLFTETVVSGLNLNVQINILINTKKLVELCVCKLSQDCFPLLDLLALVLNPAGPFHAVNATKPSLPAQIWAKVDPFASPLVGTPKGWLVDLVNHFGRLNGFTVLEERFLKGPALSVPVLASLIKPFGLCSEVLTPSFVESYFQKIMYSALMCLEGLNDQDLKIESESEAKSDVLFSIIESFRQLFAPFPSCEKTVKNLEFFFLKLTLRILQISTFSGKMNALSEINKVLHTFIIQARSPSSASRENKWLTRHKMVSWIQANDVLGLVLKDSLQHPEHVDKLETILRFMMKQKVLTMGDLHRRWGAESGRDDAIVKKIHLFSKLAEDFSPQKKFNLL